jgi:hypothetical protein
MYGVVNISYHEDAKVQPSTLISGSW